MKGLILRVLAAVGLLCAVARDARAEKDVQKSLFDFTAKSINGEMVPLSKYKNKVILVVNSASKCGFTPQYHDLEELYKQYKDRGLEILAFPSNDFHNQEPGSNEEIKKFCQLRFGVTFPLFERGAVTGAQKQPVFKFLTEQGNEKMRGEIGWNFEKFLVGPDGELKARFGSYVNPQSNRIRSKIEAMLPK